MLQTFSVRSHPCRRWQSWQLCNWVSRTSYKSGMWPLFCNVVGHHHKKILGNKISCLPASPYERITHSHNSTLPLESKLPSYISLYLWLYFQRTLRTFIHTWKSKNKEGEEGKRKGGGRGEGKEIYLCFTVIREGGGRRWCRWNRIAYESLFVEGGDKYTEVHIFYCAYFVCWNVP